jgi:hypothetical protein
VDLGRKREARVLHVYLPTKTVGAERGFPGSSYVGRSKVS